MQVFLVFVKPEIDDIYVDSVFSNEEKAFTKAAEIRDDYNRCWVENYKCEV